MEKCWFVLRQTHYPAPEYAHPNMAHGEAEGPLLLGHVIPSPKDIDQVINLGSIAPFPRDMRIWLTTTVEFHLSNSNERGVERSVTAGAPVAAAAGLTANAQAGLIFRRTMGNNWNIDRLDTHIVQPSMAYLEQCRRSAHVAAWVEKNKMLGAWSVYMISGLMIARGAKGSRDEMSEVEVHAGFSVDVPGMATAEVDVKDWDNKGLETSGENVTDFVWAIRLSKVSKSLFRSDLSQRIFTKGTTFAPDSNNVDVKAVLAEEGLDGEDVHTMEVFIGGEQQFLITMDRY